MGLACLGLFVATKYKMLPQATYTYYSSPGPLPLFLLGSFLYRRDWLLLSILTAATLVTLWIGLGNLFNKELMIGVVCGLPAIALLSRLKTNSLDSALGNASYGCYLSHVMFFIVLKHVLGEPMGTYSPVFRVTAIGLACLGGYLGYLLVEKPTVPFRRRLKLDEPTRRLRRGEAVG